MALKSGIVLCLAVAICCLVTGSHGTPMRRRFTSGGSVPTLRKRTSEPVVLCMMPSCADSQPVPGDCPVCPNGPNCQGPDGTIYPAGEGYETVGENRCHTSCTCGDQWSMWSCTIFCEVEAPVMHHESGQQDA